jgi:hypothetical protein
VEQLEAAELGHDHAFVAGHLRERPLTAEAGDRRVHQTRVARRELLVAEAQPLGDRRTERLDDDVGVVGQPAHGVDAVRSGEVGEDAALAAREVRERGRLSQHCSPGRLDPHHVGTEVGEHLAHLGAEPGGRQVDHPKTIERVHSCPPGCRRARRSP